MSSSSLNLKQHISRCSSGQPAWTVRATLTISFVKKERKPKLQFSFLHPDIVYHPWKKEDAGNQSRVIMYTISLSNPLAPKTATVTETQVKQASLLSHPNILSFSTESTFIQHIFDIFLDSVQSQSGE